MAVLEIEGLGQVEVDDTFTDFSPAEQQEFVDQLTQSVEGGVTSGSISLGLPEIETPPTAEEAGTGFFERAGELFDVGGRQFAGSSAEGIAAVLDRFNIAPETQIDLEKYADRQDVEISKIPGIKPIQDAEDVGDVASSILEYTGMSLPAMGASVATGAVTGGLTGSAFGPVGTLLGAIGGGAGALYLSFVGENVAETKRATGRENLTDSELNAAMTTAVGQSLADSLINRLLPFKGSTKAIQNTLTKVVAGTGIEGSTELTQEALTILQANDFDVEALRTPESKRRLTEATLAGAGAGGTIAGVTGPFTTVRPETQEGAEAAAEAEALEGPAVASEREIFEDIIAGQTDTDANVLKEISDAVQGLAENSEEVTFADLQQEIESKRIAVKEALKKTKKGTKQFQALKAQQNVINSAKKKLNQVAPAVRQRNLTSADIGNQGQVRAVTRTSKIASGTSLLAPLVRLGTQATTPMAVGAAKDTTGVLPQVVARMNNYDPIVKNISANFINPIYDTAQTVAKAVKIPLTSSVSKPRKQGIAQILNFSRNAIDEDITVNEEIKKVLNNFREDERLAILNAANTLKKNNDRIFKELVSAGIFTNEDYLPGYMSASHKWVRKGEKGIQQFVDSVSKVPGISRSQADRIARNIVKDFELAEKGSDVQFTSRDLAMRGSVIGAVRKEAGFEKERTLPRQITDQLFRDGLIDDDVFNVNTRYAQQAANSIAMKTLFGDSFGSDMKRIAELNADPDVRTAVTRGREIYDALQGRYNPYGVPGNWRGFLSKLIQAEYILTLSTAGITALSEPIIILSRARPGDLFYAIPKALNVAYRKSIREIFPRLSKSETEKEFSKLLYGIDSVLSERLISSSAVDVSNIVTEKYFKLNLLAQVTQFSRALAYFAGKRAIDRDLAIARGIPSTKAGIRDKKNAERRLSELGLKNLDNITPEARQIADIRIVDDFIMTPNIVNRPLWMSNPALAPVAQLKSFMFVFGNVVGARAYNELIRSKNLEGEPLDVQERAKRLFQFTVAFTLLTGAAGFLKMFKDALRNWDDEDEDYDAHGPEFWTEAFISSNLFGPYTMLFDAVKAPKYGVSSLVSLAGPAAGQLERIAKAASAFITTGNATPLAKELVRIIPFIGANPSTRRQIVKEIEEGILDGTIDISAFTDI